MVLDFISVLKTKIIPNFGLLSAAIILFIIPNNFFHTSCVILLRMLLGGDGLTIFSALHMCIPT